ncbi:MAG: hypothetical protein CMJ49_11165 [Planctomycetaceae bacterium]|nr:hypothetical protein [Planctomycetaceae bacterium]
MSESSLVSLCPADQEALDALVDAGFELQAVPDDLQPRAERLMQVLGLLDHLPAESTGDLLVARTLQRVNEARQQQRYSQQIQDLNTPRSLLRWPDLIAVAAVMLIGVSIVLTTFKQDPASANQIACATNLQGAFKGLSAYANDYGTLPVMRLSSSGRWNRVNTFDDDGSTQSNSANQLLAVNTQHVDLDNLACPENPNALLKLQPEMRDFHDARQISFSIQNMFGAEKPRMDGLRMAILSDRNPYFAGGRFNPNSGDVSPNHRRQGGQNVLFTDGTVSFIKSANTDGGDNIWHQGNVKRASYNGTELPNNRFDAFLVP